MPFKSFEKPDTPEGEESPDKKDVLFEVKKRIGNFDVSVGISRGEKPIEGHADLNKKEVEIYATPEGIRKTFAATQKFLERPEVKQTMISWTEKLKETSDKLRKKMAQETIKEYAKQEGKTEAEIVEQFLDELNKESKED